MLSVEGISGLQAGEEVNSLDQDFRQFEREGLAFQLLQADGPADATA
jgi:hypothetical protein